MIPHPARLRQHHEMATRKPSVLTWVYTIHKLAAIYCQIIWRIVSWWTKKNTGTFLGHITEQGSTSPVIPYPVQLRQHPLKIIKNLEGYLLQTPITSCIRPPCSTPKQKKAALVPSNAITTRITPPAHRVRIRSYTHTELFSHCLQVSCI